jgi:epoxyqueuosine reductase QueG
MLIKNENLTIELINYCDNIGIDLVGFANPEFFDKYQLDNRPSSFLEKTKSVVIIGLHLYDLLLDAWSKDENKNVNYHYADSILVNQCHKIKNFLAKNGFKSKIIPYKPGLFLKEAAALAGIGPIGKNNLLITAKYGSQVRLRALATDAPLLKGNPIYESNYCIDCDICVEACPANAFSEGKYNKDVCLAYCLANLKKLSDNTVLWCNICIECCPIGKD